MRDISYYTYRETLVSRKKEKKEKVCISFAFILYFYFIYLLFFCLRVVRLSSVVFAPDFKVHFIHIASPPVAPSLPPSLSFQAGLLFHSSRTLLSLIVISSSSSSSSGPHIPGPPGPPLVLEVPSEDQSVIVGNGLENGGDALGHPQPRFHDGSAYLLVVGCRLLVSSFRVVSL